VLVEQQSVWFRAAECVVYVAKCVVLAAKCVV
jgi:hypothetical protein